MKCLAIDDEPLALQQLVVYIKKIPFLELAGECQSAEEARKIMEDENIDAIFIDINASLSADVP
jgi:DNA-binding LytR/AlgR family response regulator